MEFSPIRLPRVFLYALKHWKWVKKKSFINLKLHDLKNIETFTPIRLPRVFLYALKHWKWVKKKIIDNLKLHDLKNIETFISKSISKPIIC